jgi:hypothetical protein
VCEGIMEGLAQNNSFSTRPHRHYMLKSGLLYRDNSTAL